MARVCEVCGKGVHAGNTIVRHGLRKAKGGIGLHTTGVTKRRFLPNLQRIRVSENGGVKRKTVCTACIRSNKITKA
jgi:large subunit ribosomal protein L28